MKIQDILKGTPAANSADQIVKHFTQNAFQDRIYDIEDGDQDSRMEEIADQVAPVFHKMKLSTGDEEKDEELIWNATHAVYNKFFG